jgi:hypothetical protein
MCRPKHTLSSVIPCSDVNASTGPVAEQVLSGTCVLQQCHVSKSNAGLQIRIANQTDLQLLYVRVAKIQVQRKVEQGRRKRHPCGRFREHFLGLLSLPGLHATRADVHIVCRAKYAMRSAKSFARRSFRASFHFCAFRLLSAPFCLCAILIRSAISPLSNRPVALFPFSRNAPCAASTRNLSTSASTPLCAQQCRKHAHTMPNVPCVA